MHQLMKYQQVVYWQNLSRQERVNNISLYFNTGALLQITSWSDVSDKATKGAGQMLLATAYPAYLHTKPFLSTNRRMSSPNTSVPIG